MEILVLPVPYRGKEALLAPLRCGEALRAIPVPNRHGLKAAQQPPAVRSSSAHSSRARTAERAEAGASEPLCRPTGAPLPLSPRKISTPPAGRHNAVPQGTAVLTKQTNRPCQTEGAQLRRKRVTTVTCVGHGVERCAHERGATRPACGRSQ